MATSNTTNLNLIKETSAEPIVNHRGHFNDNMDLIDAAYNTLASRSRGQQTWGNLKQNTTWGELIGTNVVAATTTTDNLELIQPGYDSTVDVESFNDNMSILDSTIGAIDVTNDGSIADQLSSVRDSLSWKSVDINLTMTNEETSYTKTVTQLINATCVILLCSRPSSDTYTVLPMIIRSDKAKSGTGLASKPLRSNKMFGDYDFTIDVDIEWSTGLVRIRNGYRGGETPALTLAKAMYLK